jgi:PAS domain S-box-containing protein
MSDQKREYLKDELYALMRAGPGLFEFLQQGSLDGIWYWNLENPEDEWMSPRFWEILGYDPAQKEHKVHEWQDLIHPDDLKVALENYEKHREDPRHPYDQVVRYRHKDGSTVWVRCRGIIIRDDEGRPIRMLGAHTDLTRVKRAEEELREKKQQLEEALARIKTLKGLLPICSHCKSIKDEKGSWQAVEFYIADHSEAEFTHGICPTCIESHHPDLKNGK